MSRNDEIICPILLKWVTDYWSLRILNELRKWNCRFSELRKKIEWLNAVTLTNRLKDLEKIYLISRLEESIDKQSVVYSLTDLWKESESFINEAKYFVKKIKQYDDLKKA